MHTHSNNSIINNSQIYRNNNAGIIIENDSHDNIINNSQLYNNGHGIWLEVNSYNTRINNTQIYNNRLGISNTATSSGNKYYGDVKIFGNARNGIPNDINDYYVGSGFTT